MDCARTLPPVDGNKVEQGVPKGSCLETDPWYLLGLGGETLKVWALFFWTSNWTANIFSPKMFKAKPHEAEGVQAAPALPKASIFRIIQRFAS